MKVVLCSLDLSSDGLELLKVIEKLKFEKLGNLDSSVLLGRWLCIILILALLLDSRMAVVEVIVN